MFEQWQLFPPEANYYKLVMGAGPAPSVAAAEAYTGHAAAITATIGVSSGLAPATASSFVGMAGTESTASLANHNGQQAELAAAASVRAEIHNAAAAAHPAAVGQMVPAPVAHANRVEEQFDNDINPLVLGALTPRIADLEMEYFGFMWPNNASAGLRYGATLDALGSVLMSPSMPAISGGSIAAVAVAAATVAESAAMSGMQAAVGMVGSGASAVVGPAAALPATAMSAVSSSGSSTTGAPATSAPVQPLGAVAQYAPPTPAQTLAPAQSSTGMYAPSPNANLMVPPPVPPTTQAPVQPMMPRPPVTPPMSAAPGVTTFTPPAEPFSPPPPPSGGKAVGLKPGMLNASALRGPVSAMPMITNAANGGLATATQPLAYVVPDVPRPVSPMPPQQPPVPNNGDLVHSLNPPPQPQQQPPQPSPPQRPPPSAQPQQHAPAPPQLGQEAAGRAQMAGFQRAPLPLDPTTPTTPEPAQCKSEDQAKFIKKFAEWCAERDRISREATDWDRKYEPGHPFNMNDPAQAAEYERGEKLRQDRAKLIRDYGELLKEATTCGAKQDEKTGDIVWPDGTRTTLRPPG